MSQLQKWQQIMQEKRKQTPWREFVKTICSWRPLVLHKNNDLISRYPEERILSVTNDPLHKRISIDYNGVFWTSFFELFQQQEHLATTNFYNNENSDFSDGSRGGKNIYLSFDAGGGSNNILYSHLVFDQSSNIVQSSLVGGSQNIFDSSAIYNSSNVFYSRMIRDSSFIYSSESLIGCSYCINCSGIENQSYCIQNKKVEKSSFHSYLKKKRNETIFDKIKTGQSSFLCTHTTNTYFSNRIQNGNNIAFGIGGECSEYIFDGMNCGLNSQHLYGISATGDRSSHLYCVAEAGNSSFCFYCYHIESCSFCLGCLGLKNKSYCILNKQYEKDERHRQVDMIFSKMHKEGTLGDFFPGQLNPFYFNDTAAYLLDDSFSKNEVEAEGYLWRDEKIDVDIPQGVEIVYSKNLGEFESLYDEKLTIDPSILTKVICDESGNYYRIVRMEYDFLVKHGLPLPRKHWLERLKGHFA